MGLILTLFTNGTLVTDRIAERLAEAPPALTQITLYGATAATYEAVTGVPGGYARCCAGIEALLKQRVPFDLRTTITQQNAGELEAMRQMAHQWGVSFSGAWMLMQRRDGNASRVENCRLSARECVSLEAEDRASADEWIETASRDISGKRESNFNCQAGKSLFVVNSYGEMNLCVSLAKPAARPLDIGFRAAWEALQRFVDEAPPPAAACVACDARKFCPRCPAWSSVETATLTEPVPYLCDIAGIRKERYEGMLK
jgi:radical SAM protein with 4Fe4S-binding SPASM domain